MQIIVMHSRLSRPRVLNVPTRGLFAGLVLAGASLLMLVGAGSHFVMLKGARDGWPVVSQILAPFSRAEFAQRDRYLRENLDAMAAKVGELQAKLVKLDSMGERVSGLAGLKPDDFRALDREPLLSAPSRRSIGAGRPLCADGRALT